MAMIGIKANINVHNKFEIVLTDVRTGVVKQRAWAYNLILNQGRNRIVANFNDNDSAPEGSTRFIMGTGQGSDTVRRYKRFGGAIHVGKGTGEVVATRSSLFTYLSGRVTTHHDRSYDIDELLASYTQKAVWDETLLRNESITEVGLAAHTDATWLSTHALIEDSEGNPITVQKGEFDILTVYSTVYMSISHSYGENFKFISGVHATIRNALLDMVARNTSINTSHAANRFAYRLVLGRNKDAVTVLDPIAKTPILTKDYVAQGTHVSYGENSITFSTRIPVAEANHADGIWELGFAIYQGSAEFSPTTYTMMPLFRAIMPITGVWQGYAIEGEELGTGDEENKNFSLDWKPIVAESETIYVDGVAKTRGTDYTINNTTGAIGFTAAPGSGLAVTADYSVEFIPKDVNHVLDVSFTIQFADGNA